MSRPRVVHLDYVGTRYKLGLHGLMYRWNPVSQEWINARLTDAERKRVLQGQPVVPGNTSRLRRQGLYKEDEL